MTFPLIIGHQRMYDLNGAAPVSELLRLLVKGRVLRAVSSGPDELVRSLHASIRQHLPTLEVHVRLNRESTVATVFVSRRFTPPLELDLTRSLRRLRRLRLPGLSAAVLRCLGAATWRTRAVLCPHHVPDLDLHTLAYGEPWEQEQLLGRTRRPPTSRRGIIHFLHQQGHVVPEDARWMYDQEASLGRRTLEESLPGLPRALQGPLAQLHGLASEATSVNALVGTGQCPADLQVHRWARTRSAKRDGLEQLAEHLYNQQRENGFGPMYAQSFTFDEVGVPLMLRALRDFAQLDRLAIRATHLAEHLGVN